MRNNNAVAPNFVSAFDETEQPQRQRVVQADNKPTSPGNTALAYLAMFIIAGSVGIAGALNGWALATVIIASSTLAVILALIVHVSTNGDLPAIIDIIADMFVQKHKTNKQAQVLMQARELQHIETLQQIEVDRVMAEVQLTQEQRLLATEQASSKLLVDTHAKRKQQERHPSFVPAASVAAREAAYDYAVSLFTRTGLDSELVHHNRQLKRSAPWNTTWKNEEWCDEAKAILTTGNKPFLVQEQLPKGNHSYFVSPHYPTTGHVQRKLFA